MSKAEPEINYVIKCASFTTSAIATVDEARIQAKLLDVGSPNCGPHRVFKRTLEEVTDV